VTTILTTRPKRRRYKRSTDPLDMRLARRILAADHEERMRAPRAPACACGSKAYGEAGHCWRCGHDLKAPQA
jgi:hypothetical protein